MSDRFGPLTKVDRQIFSLALPALGTLVAEPLLTTADAAMIGHVGTAELGGLTVGSSLVNLVVGLCIFLAYSTTAVTAKYMGKNDRFKAVSYSIQGIWLATFIGIIMAVAIWLLAPLATTLMGANAQTHTYAVTYLRYCSPGVAFMLVVLGANGAFRGLLNTKTPFIITTVGILINIPLNAVFIYGFNMSVAGSGLGTSCAQFLMASTMCLVIVRSARHMNVPIHPMPAKMMANGFAGLPLVIRSVCLQISVLTTVRVATTLGTTELAAYKTVDSLYNITIFVMDALAIAAQALIGNAIGRGDKEEVRALMNRCVTWGVRIGCGLSIILVCISPVAGYLFTSDPAVLSISWAGYLANATWLPLAGAVFMYDGILIGAGDNKYLALAQAVTLLYVPIVLVVSTMIPSGRIGVVVLLLCFGSVLMGLRFLTLYMRARHDTWLNAAISRQ